MNVVIMYCTHTYEHRWIVNHFLPKPLKAKCVMTFAQWAINPSRISKWSHDEKMNQQKTSQPVGYKYSSNWETTKWSTKKFMSQKIYLPNFAPTLAPRTLICILKPGLPDFSWHNIPKLGEICQIANKLQNGHTMYQLAEMYYNWPKNIITNLFHSKALQNDPIWDFWFENIPSGNPARNFSKFLSAWK
jgi:hypothetical protein